LCLAFILSKIKWLVWFDLPSVKLWEALADRFGVHYKGIQQQYNENRKTEDSLKPLKTAGIPWSIGDVIGIGVLLGDN
jgi:hypothetical protein